eukprot:TRINITY_DN9516_c0_g1_i1.p1 TRINITY_DN9516_c0_g1~~TRINITY_DN9516_c0_g1_i1.p1  ORF type:complete len:679 (+),score=192.78 TRINITY_DN9516_c0_g1_i1:154-2190(+)
MASPGLVAGGSAVLVAAAAFKGRSGGGSGRRRNRTGGGAAEEASPTCSPRSSSGDPADTPNSSHSMPSPRLHPDGKLGAQEFAQMWSSLSPRERERIEAGGGGGIDEAIRRYVRRRESESKGRKGDSPMRLSLLRRPRKGSEDAHRGAVGESPRQSSLTGSPRSPNSPDRSTVAQDFPGMDTPTLPPTTAQGGPPGLLKRSNPRLGTHACPDVPEGGCSPGGAPAKEVAFRVLQDNVALVVCSYCAPHVFERFLNEQLEPDDASALRQTMRGVSNTLDEEGKRRFGDVILGCRSEDEDDADDGGIAAKSGATSPRGDSSAKVEAEERWAVRSGGLLHGSDKLLRDFVEQQPGFAEYLSLTLVNPFVAASLGRASARWAELHPPADTPVLEPCFSRIVVNPAGVVVRGAAGPALLRNLESRFAKEEWHEAADLHKRLEGSLSEVLLVAPQPQLNRRSRARASAVVRRVITTVTAAKEHPSAQGFDEVAQRIARMGLLRLAGVDPHTSPAGLICHDLSLVRDLVQRQQRSNNELASRKGKKVVTLASGSKASRLTEALAAAQAAFEDLRRRDAGEDRALRTVSYKRRHSAPAMNREPTSPRLGNSSGSIDPAGDSFQQSHSGSEGEATGSPTSQPTTPTNLELFTNFGGGSMATSFCGNPMHNRSVFVGASSAPSGRGFL